MFPMFNRYREKDSSYPVGYDVWYFSGYPNCSKLSYDYLERVVWTSITRRKTIRDYVPVGPYIEGVFKITDVELNEIKDEETVVDYYQPHSYPCNPRHYVGKSGPNHIWAYIAAPAYLPALTDIPDKEVATARIRGFSKLNDPKVGLGETFAEAGKSLRMLVNPLGGMANIIKTCLFKKGKSGIRRTAKDAASAWLELRYGWIPLYKTVQSMIQPFKTDGMLDVVAKEKSSSITSVHLLDFLYEGSGLLFDFNIEIHDEVTKAYRIYYNVVDKQLYGAFRNGSSAFQVPQLLWELTHLSFVLDWWIDLGDQISAMIVNPSVNILGASYSIKRSKITRLDVCNVYYPLAYGNPVPLYGPNGAKMSFIREQNYYLRVVDKTPVPKWSTPDFSSEFKSWKHAVDSLGLIIQRAL